MGKLRSRFPVAAKMALARAGAKGGTPGSPTPFTFPPSANIYTSICGGVSLIRTTGLS